jgi:hypothetical protein
MDWVLDNIDVEIPQPGNKNIKFVTTTMKAVKVSCPNGAPISTYPYCCKNGAKNEFCCTGPHINPTCSEPTTTTPAPSCPNGASISTYPHCCLNGAKNVYCCTGVHINPTCSAPPQNPPIKTALAPTCSNGASSSTYPHCCLNGARNEFCCTGPYINPTCSPPIQHRLSFINLLPPHFKNFQKSM